MEKSRAWAEVDISAIKANLDAVRKIVAPARVLACVKANAYGLGASRIASFLEKGVEIFCVASVVEGAELRRAGIKNRILVLGLVLKEELEEGLKNGLEFTVAEREAAGNISKAALKLRKKAVVHLKVDTGMGRIGMKAESFPEFRRWCRGLPAVKVESVYVHLPVAETRNRFTLGQIDKFRKATDPLTFILSPEGRGKKVRGILRHAANSAAIFNYPEIHFDLVRAGISVYGAFPFDPAGSPHKSLLHPAATLGSRVVFLKEIDRGDSVSYGRTFRAKKRTGVATVSIGYADGYGRNLSNKASVLVAGRRCPVIGNICMDMLMVDVSGVVGIKLGDEVILIGRQGKGEIRVEEVAGWAGTVPHEILSRIGPRVNRIYKHEK
jgi:alanine racemase